MYANYHTDERSYYTRNPCGDFNYCWNLPIPSACDSCCRLPINCLNQTSTDDSIKNFPISYKKLSNMPEKWLKINREMPSATSSSKLNNKVYKNKKSKTKPKKEKTKSKSKSKSNKAKSGGSQETIIMENEKLNSKSSILNKAASRSSSLKINASEKELLIKDSSVSEYLTPIVRLSFSESVVGNKSAENVKLKKSNSFCEYQCFCRKSEKCARKPDLDFKLLTHYDKPIKRIHQADDETYSVVKSKSFSQTSNAQHKQQEKSFCKNVSLNSFKQSAASTNYISHPLQCCCCCCRNELATMKNCLNSSLSSSKSYPQLEVITEEESLYEDHQTPSNSKSGQQQTTNLKPLEETCEDFLNIISDNILESVENSVDCKLKEFSCQSTESFRILCRKLENNETALRSLCCDMMQKMARQNKLHFEKIFSLVQDLAEIQKQTVKKVFQNTNEQSVSVTGRETDNEKINKNDIQILRCGCCQCCCPANFFDNFSNTRDTAKNALIQDATVKRKSGGCINQKENENQLKEKIKIWGWPLKCATSKNSFPHELLTEMDLIQEKCPLPHTFTTFSLTRTGKTVFNCNYCKDSAVVEAGRTTESSGFYNKNAKLNYLDTEDSCEANGYVSAPQFNERQVVDKKLHKKILKSESTVEASGAIVPKAMGW